MSYGRFNYVAQPEDKVKQLIPVIAPYDNFAISWGYKGIPGAKSLTGEKTLASGRRGSSRAAVALRRRGRPGHGRSDR